MAFPLSPTMTLTMMVSMISLLPTVSSLSLPLSTSLLTPIFGIGAVLFRPKGMEINPSMGDNENLVEAGRFFTEAFWSSKVGVDDNGLLPAQISSLERQQVNEFQRRYGSKAASLSRQDSKAELFACTNANGDIMGCVGMEVDIVKKPSSNASSSSGALITAPLMSNLAVGKTFRRRGVAEELVQRAEDMARKQWGYNECYLYVEKQNVPAVRLYQKMGYRRVWQDEDARTMVPTAGGKLKNSRTVIVCMKKRLGMGVLGRFMPL